MLRVTRTKPMKNQTGFLVLKYRLLNMKPNRNPKKTSNID